MAPAFAYMSLLPFKHLILELLFLSVFLSFSLSLSLSLSLSPSLSQILGGFFHLNFSKISNLVQNHVQEVRADSINNNFP